MQCCYDRTVAYFRVYKHIRIVIVEIVVVFGCCGAGREALFYTRERAKCSVVRLGRSWGRHQHHRLHHLCCSYHHAVPSTA